MMAVKRSHRAKSPEGAETRVQLLRKLQQEDRLTLPHARNLFAVRPSLATLQRWTKHGYGRRIKLESYKEGKVLVTTKQAVERFILAVSEL